MNDDQMLTISFRLTRLQRVVNPITRLGLALIGVGGYIALICGVVILVLRNINSTGAWTAITSLSFWISLSILTFGFVLISFFTGKSIIGVYLCLTKDYYINTVRIAERTAFFGFNGIQREMLFPSMVYRGLLGTYILSDGGSCALTLPKEAIPLEKLQEWIKERKDYKRNNNSR